MTNGKSKNVDSAADALIAFVLIAFLGSNVALIRKAGAEEFGVALRNLGIPAITNADRLVALGCTDALKITKKVVSSGQKKTQEGTFRSYSFAGMDLTTITVEVEVVLGARVPAPYLPQMGILNSTTLTLSALNRKFGNPFEIKNGAAIFTSDDDERAMVLANFLGDKLTTVYWSCG
jgi:hypothetical protein